MTVTENSVDPIKVHLNKDRKDCTSYSMAVQNVMSMKAPKVRKLLKELVEIPADTTQNAVVDRLITARLVEVEMRFRAANNFSATLLPFNAKDYAEALTYAQSREHLYETTEVVSEDGEGKKGKGGKRGRKGGSFDRVKEYLLNNPKMLEKEFEAPVAAAALEKELSISYNTAINYLYKCRRMQKKGELK